MKIVPYARQVKRITRRLYDDTQATGFQSIYQVGTRFFFKSKDAKKEAVRSCPRGLLGVCYTYGAVGDMHVYVLYCSGLVFKQGSSLRARQRHLACAPYGISSHNRARWQWCIWCARRAASAERASATRARALAMRVAVASWLRLRVATGLLVPRPAIRPLDPSPKPPHTKIGTALLHKISAGKKAAFIVQQGRLLCQIRPPFSRRKCYRSSLTVEWEVS